MTVRCCQALLLMLFVVFVGGVVDHSCRLRCMVVGVCMSCAFRLTLVDFVMYVP